MKIEVEKDILRKRINKLDTVLFRAWADENNKRFGEIATIIEAAITDESQKKSLKDLVSKATYGNGYFKVINHQIDCFSRSFGINPEDNRPDGSPTLVESNPYEEIS